MYLSKTDFIQSKDCLSSLWFSKHQPEVLNAPSEADRFRMQQGTEFETLVRERFPDGVLIREFGDAAAQATHTLIEGDSQCLFQATAIHANCLARADVLERDDDSDGWRLYEVKSSTKVKPDHLLDAAFQTWVFRKSGIRITRVFVVTANNAAVLDGTPDAHDFSTLHDVTAKVENRIAEVEYRVTLAQEVMSAPQPPPPSTSSCLHSPSACRCAFHCYPELPVDNVFTIPRIRTLRARQLYDEGLVRISDLPSVTEFNDKQSRYIRAVRSGSAQINRSGLRRFLSRLQYPLCFLDYETAGTVIPLFGGYRPYTQIVFQYSLHILDEPNGPLRHMDYLADGVEDPAVQLGSALNEAMPQSGSVLVWNQSFEAARNRELAERLPPLSSFFLDLNERIVDLMEIVDSGLNVDPAFLGSASIKNVLPVLVPEMNYEELEISDGGQASLEWMKMRVDEDEDRVRQTRNNLLKYCCQDTLAMVRLLKVFETTAM